MSKNKQVRLKKIPLSEFINVLTDIYSMGVDYVDIIGVPDEEQDSISITFTKEYMSEELSDELDKYEEKEEERNIDINLSDDDDVDQLS